MPVKAVRYYKADDGKSYSTFEEATKAQKAYTAKQIAIRAHKAQQERLYSVLAKISQNTSTNSLIVQELLMKPDLAIEFRDAMNKVVDYFRRKTAPKKA
jgi:hypothetical protein